MSCLFLISGKSWYHDKLDCWRSCLLATGNKIVGRVKQVDEKNFKCHYGHVLTPVSETKICLAAALISVTMALKFQVTDSTKCFALPSWARDRKETQRHSLVEKILFSSQKVAGLNPDIFPHKFVRNPFYSYPNYCFSTEIKVAGK